MGNDNVNKKKVLSRDIWISVAVIVLVFVLVLCGLLTKFDYRVYDFMLGLKPATEERDDVVMVAIDDQSIAELGSFPWSRDIIADTIVRMRELGAKTVVFDIEYLSPSALGINPTARAALPGDFDTAEMNVVSLLQDLSDAVA